MVGDDGLFAPGYPDVILVALTDDAALTIPDLSVAIMPDQLAAIRRQIALAIGIG